MQESSADPDQSGAPLTATDLGKELMISDEATGRVSVLNKTARLVWELHHDGLPDSAIADRLIAAYPKLAPETALADVGEIMQAFRDSGLLGRPVVADTPKRLDGACLARTDRPYQAANGIATESASPLAHRLCEILPDLAARDIRRAQPGLLRQSLDLCGVTVTIATDMPSVIEELNYKYRDDLAPTPNGKAPRIEVLVVAHKTADTDLAIATPYRFTIVKETADRQQVYYGYEDRYPAHNTNGSIERYVGEALMSDRAFPSGVPDLTQILVEFNMLHAASQIAGDLSFVHEPASKEMVERPSSADRRARANRHWQRRSPCTAFA